MYTLRFTEDTSEALDQLRSKAHLRDKAKKVFKALALLEKDPRYPGLHSHQYEQFPGYVDAKIWDSYVENGTPSAWRIFWMYGPNETDPVTGADVHVITVVAITPHP